MTVIGGTVQRQGCGAMGKVVDRGGYEGLVQRAEAIASYASALPLIQSTLIVSVRTVGYFQTNALNAVIVLEK